MEDTNEMRALRAKDKRSIAARDQSGVQEGGDGQCEIKQSK
jgi:hypothetical protein